MGIFDKLVRSLKGPDPHVLRGHATRLEFTDLARATGIGEEEFMRILQTVAAEYFPRRRLETSLGDCGRASLHCFFRVCALVVDAATECTVGAARRVDPDADEGDEIGVEICAQAMDARRAQYFDDEFGSALGLFTDVPAFRRALQQRLGARLGLEPLPPVEIERRPEGVDVRNKFVAEMAIDVLCKALEAGAPLSAPEETVWLAWSASGILGNGGLAYFYEHDLAPQKVAAAFNAVGLSTLGQALVASAQLFPQCRVPPSLQERIARIDAQPLLWERLSSEVSAAPSLTDAALMANIVRYLEAQRETLPRLGDVFLVADSLRTETSPIVTLIATLATTPFHIVMLTVPDAAEAPTALETLGFDAAAASVRERLRWFAAGAAVTQDERSRVEYAMDEIRTELPSRLAAYLRGQPRQ